MNFNGNLLTSRVLYFSAQGGVWIYIANFRTMKLPRPGIRGRLAPGARELFSFVKKYSHSRAFHARHDIRGRIPLPALPALASSSQWLTVTSSSYRITGDTIRYVVSGTSHGCIEIAATLARPTYCGLTCSFQKGGSRNSLRGAKVLQLRFNLRVFLCKSQHATIKLL